MKTRRLLCQILALVLCALLIFPLTALAEGDEAAAEETEGYAVIDPEAMEKLVKDYLRIKEYRTDKVSIGYCYLDTGDTWFFNPDVWRYSAAMYRMPLTMIFAEKEHNGELTQDSDLKGQTLAQAEENILVYNSNDATHKLMDILGSERDVRELYRAYSAQPEEYYDPDFYDYSYFTVRFTTDVIKTLYYENERFPQILDLMKRSDNGKYFHGALGKDYEVAQRTGVFTDRRGVQYNNATAVIYTEHPFVLTVMLQDLGTDDAIFRDLAGLFKDYTLTLDEPYAAWEETRKQTAEAPAVTEEPAAEEPATEEPATEEVIVAEAPAEETAAPETPEEQAPAETQTEEKPTSKLGSAAPYLRLGVILIAVALLFILLLGELVHLILQGKKRGDED